MGEETMDTKRIISTALLDLLKDHRFDDITVQDVIEKAHVSRSTFYRHFEDKYELMTWHYQDYLDTLTNVSSFDSWRKNLVLALSFLQANSSYYKKVLKTSDGKALWKQIYDHSYKAFINFYEANFPEAFQDTDTILRIKFYCYGSTDLACEWLRDGCPVDAEKFADILTDFVPPRLRGRV